MQSDADLDAYIRQVAMVSMHPVGTCAIGEGESAVVDPQLRVIGVERLRVVDASVMPTVPGANTNATTVMIGEKAADSQAARRQAGNFDLPASGKITELLNEEPR